MQVGVVKGAAADNAFLKRVPMKARKPAYALVLALLAHSCVLENTCTVGEEASCPAGAFCYGGERPRKGSLGICTQANVSDEAPSSPELPLELNLEERGENEESEACAEANRVPVDIQRNQSAHITLGLPMGFENNGVALQRGNTRGLMGVAFDAARNQNVAFVAWQHLETLSDMAALTAFMQQHATTLSAQNLVYGPFTSWGVPSAQANALSVVFQMAGSMSPAERANDIAEKLLGPGSGSLPDTGTAGDIQHIRAEYVLGEQGEGVVVVAVALDNDSLTGSTGFFGLNDVAGGTALASYFDKTRLQCERLVATRKAVDFLFVVDDSASMASQHSRLAETVDAMVNALNNSHVDWRVALVTSSYHLVGSASNRGIVRGFTNNAQQIQAWLRPNSWCVAGRCSRGCARTETIDSVTRCVAGTEFPEWQGDAPTCTLAPTIANGGCWIGTQGVAQEGILGAARLALLDMHAPDASFRFQPGADIVVILLSDAPDQTSGLRASHTSQRENIQNFVDFFQGKTTNNVPGHTGELEPARAGVTIPVHAIYCPAGTGCGDDPVPDIRPARIEQIANETGGILSSIQAAVIPNTMAEIVSRSIGAAGIRIQKPPIGASLRVSMDNPMPEGSCHAANVPRSRQQGFDYDGMAQTLSFFGDCRPQPGQHISVTLSYRSWEASSHPPCENNPYFHFSAPGHCHGLFTCDFDTDICICPPACGGCPAGMRCDSNICACIP